MRAGLLMVVIAALAGAACAGAREPAAPAAPDAIVAYRDSGEWAADTTRAAGRARRYLVRHARDVRRPALVLDIDDTTLSSYPCLRRAGFDRSAMGACIARGRMPVIRPVRRLHRAARAHHVTVFLVTGRRESARAASVRNLRRAGLHGRLRITMRPDGPRRGSNARYKARARRAIERRGYRILVNVGDQRTDLAGGHARRQVKLPNPMYVTR
jgi:acid phosphatase